jgi:hypothetical protein
MYSTAEYCCPVWKDSAHVNTIDAQLNTTLRIIPGTLKSTPKDNELTIYHCDLALAVWDVENENEGPTIPHFQKNWDNINIKRIIANDLIFNSP